MNSRALILLLVVLNLALAGYIVSLRTKPAAESTRRFQSSPPKPEVREPVPQAERTKTNRFHWAQLEAEDYREYIDRLRSIGCPEETIRDIIIADLEKLMAARVQEINGHREPPKYWQAEARQLVRTLDSLDKLHLKGDVDFEKREIIRELLGIDLAARRMAQQGEADIYEERLPFLPEEKRSKVRMILEKANREEVYLREQSWLENDELTPAEKVRLKEIEVEKEKAIQALLAPGEKEQFDLWFSPSAYRVRNSFFGLETSEEEFLGVYEIQREFDQSWGAVEPSTLGPTEKLEYDQALEERQDLIEEFLGPERYTEYQRSQDEDYRALRIAAAEYKLPPSVAEEVYQYKTIALQERAAILTNAALGASEKQMILGAIAEESERSVIDKLGPRAYRHYLRSGAGQWIWE